jgi:hypothetical protein
VPKFELYKHNDEILTYITGFFMRTTQESFQQSLVEISSVVSEEIFFFFKFHPPFFLICLIGQNRQKFKVGWSSLPKLCQSFQNTDQDGRHSRIFLSETICSIRTKFWWNSHWMVLFQKCVWRFDPAINFFFTCNFEVNLITYLGVLALFSSNLWKKN